MHLTSRPQFSAMPLQIRIRWRRLSNWWIASVPWWLEELPLACAIALPVWMLLVAVLLVF